MEDGIPFYEVRAEVDGHGLGLFARQSLSRYLDRDAEEYFATTAAGLAFFGERFDLPFPQRKSDQVFVPDMSGAMRTGDASPGPTPSSTAARRPAWSTTAWAMLMILDVAAKDFVGCVTGVFRRKTAESVVDHSSDWLFSPQSGGRPTP